MTRLLLLALLLSASAASAREVELDTAPPTCNKQAEEREDAATTDPATAPKSSGPTTPVRASGNRSATPRWNSLLPGMFR